MKYSLKNSVDIGRDEMRLIKKAREAFVKISPCRGKKSFSECFTKCENKLVLWFDTKDRSTHIIHEDIDNMK